MRSLWTAGMLLRRIRAEIRMLLLLFVAIAVTSFLFAAAPRLLDRTADDGLRYAMQTAPAAQRSLVQADFDRIAPGVGGGISGVRAAGDEFARQLPASLSALFSDRTLRITSVSLAVTDRPNYDAYVSLRYQDGVPQATRLIDGRWPLDRGVPLPKAVVTDVTRPPDGQTKAPPVVFEVAFSSAAATEMGMQVGDRLAVKLDSLDPMLGRIDLTIAPTELEVVGLFEPIDPGAAYWAGDASLLQVAKKAGTEDLPSARATAYVAAEAYPNLFTAALPFRYEWDYSIDPQRLDAGQVSRLRADLRNLGFATAASELATPGSAVVRSGMLPILDVYATQLARSETILSVAAIGPVGLAVGVLAMLAILLATRRRAGLALARGRGASGSVLLGAQLWEAVILVGAASLSGLLAALSAIPARASPLSSAFSLAVGAVVVLLLLGATWPVARRPLGQLQREDRPGRRLAPRRLVIELAVAGIAATGALMLRDRGLTVSGEGGVATFNPLLGAVPVLGGLAFGLLAVRLYPLPLRALGWFAARRRDLVPVLGLRTIGRNPAGANLAILVLLLTAAFAAFSSVIVSSIDRGQAAASYLEVGADYRIEGIGSAALSQSLDPAAIGGVEAVARAIVDAGATFTSVPNQRATIYVDAVEPQAYQQVVAGTAADPHWPGAFLAEPPAAAAGSGTDRAPIPAIVSAQLPPGSANLAPGDTFHVSVLGHDMTFRVVERRASLAGIGGRATFVVAPRGWVQAAFGATPQPPTVMWVRAPGGVAGAVAAAVTASGGSAHLDSRYDTFAKLHDAPLATAVSTGYAVALVIAATYMALAIVGVVVLSAARRNQDLAYLRTLGVTARQALGLTLMEHAPPVLLAVAPGVALGIAAAYLLEPGLGLAAFQGATGLPLSIDALALSLIVAALVGVVLVAVIAGTWLALRARLVDALRIGEH